MALPQHKQATIQFDVKLDGLTPPLIIPFDPAGGIRKNVFGAVVNNPSTMSIGDFPHEVVGASGAGTRSASWAERHHGLVENPVQASSQPRNGLLALESDPLFADSWEDRVRLNGRWGGCYSFLHRFGFGRFRNRVIIFLLAFLAPPFLGRYKLDKLGIVLFYVTGMVVYFECFVRARSLPSKWAIMPVLSVVVRQAKGASEFV